MNKSLRGAAVKFGAFVTVCVLGTCALLAVFSEFRFSREQLYRAEFTDVSGLAAGDFVRVAGVEVGKVKQISINPASLAVVEFSLDPSVRLTEGAKAAVRWENPIGDRYLALLEGAGGAQPLTPGDTIAVANTEPALDLDTLLGGFRPLFRALDPDQVNALSTQLIAVFQNEGATIGSFLNQAAAVTNTLADRDELIGQVIVNLNTVMATLGDEDRRLSEAVGSLSDLVSALAARKSDITNAVAYTNAASASVADLLSHGRAPFRNAVTQMDRVTTIVSDDKEWFDDYLNTLPEAYQTLARLGLNGAFWSFYLCDLFLKINGKGGQPVYVKLAGQSTGRCAPE